jgi:hypothetical protein
MPHIAILDDFVGEVLPDVNVLGSLSSTDDVVSPLDARRVVLVHGQGDSLSESQPLEEVAEVQDIHSCSQRRVVLQLCRRQSSSLLHLGPPHDSSWGLIEQRSLMTDEGSLVMDKKIWLIFGIRVCRGLKDWICRGCHRDPPPQEKLEMRGEMSRCILLAVTVMI